MDRRTVDEVTVLAALQGEGRAASPGELAARVSEACALIGVPDAPHNRVVLRAWLLHVLQWEQALAWLGEDPEDLASREGLLGTAREIVRDLDSAPEWLHAVREARESAAEIGDDAARHVMSRSFAGRVPVPDRGEVARYVSWWVHPLTIARLADPFDDAPRLSLLAVVDHADEVVRVAALADHRCDVVAVVPGLCSVDPWVWPAAAREQVATACLEALRELRRGPGADLALEVSRAFPFVRDALGEAADGDA